MWPTNENMEVVQGVPINARNEPVQAEKGDQTDLGHVASRDNPTVYENDTWFRRILGRLDLTKSNTNIMDYNPSFTNPDLLPVPADQRNWGKWTYGLYWFGECASVTAWTVAATGVTGGLTWWESWICVIFGTFIVAIPMTLTGRAGATYHVPFPVIARASFGVWGSYWPIINRNVMTIVWSGVQLVTTGNCFYVMLHAIFPSIAHVHNPFSSDVSMTGGKLIGFTLGWVIVVSLVFIKPSKMSGIIITKSVLMVICLVAFFGWTVGKAHGIGPIIYQGADIPKGQSHTWVFLNNLLLQASNMATFATNNADISRYARKPRDAWWTQLFGVPIAYGFIAFFGVFVTSASKPILGEIYWDPMMILDGFLTQSYDSATRAGVFFIALGFSYAQCTTMIFANLIAAGNDTSALWPRYINYTRGALLVMVVCFAINPWQLTKSSFTFTSYLGAYDIFLAAIIGVLIGDYYLVRKGSYNLNGLFSLEKSSPYYFFFGWNWRAYSAYLLGMVPVFPGFLASIGVQGVPIGAQRLYVFAFPVGIIVSALCYWGFNVWSPPAEGLPKNWSEPAIGEIDALIGVQMGRADELVKEVEV